MSKTKRAKRPRPSGVPAFKHDCHVHFSQCDPAGIVFYPQYLVLFNDVKETWFNSGLGIDYADLVQRRRVGLPTVHLEVDFVAPSTMGDSLRWRLFVLHMGNTSLQLYSECVGQGGLDDVRLYVEHTIVFTDLNTHKPIPIPDDVRQALSACGSV